MMNEFSMGAEAAMSHTVQLPLSDRTVEAEVVGEFSLPDYQPEIKRLLRIGVSALPPECLVSGGGVELGGPLSYTVLYMGHDNALYCAPLDTEYRLEVKPEAAEGGGLSIGEPLCCLCDLSPETPVGRVSAPRRLSIRCRLRARVRLLGECPLLGEEEAIPAEEREVLTETRPVGRVRRALGEPLPLADDVILAPAGEREWRVVCAEGQVLMAEATPARGQVALSGEVVLRLILSPEPASDEAPTTAEPTVMQRKIPFSQLVDLEGVSPQATATATGFCTDLSVSMEEGHLHMELNLLCEVTAAENQPVTVTRDLYSVRRESTCRYATYPAERAVHALCGNFTLSDSLPLSDVGLDAGARVVDVSAGAQAEALSVDPARGRGVLSGSCLAHLLFVREGEYGTADMTLPFRYEFDLGNTLLAGRAGDETAPADAAYTFSGGVQVLWGRARMDGERVGLDAEMAVSLRVARPEELTAVADAVAGAPIVRPRGEYRIYFPAPTDTLWTVAKRYHAPVATLAAANNLAATEELEARYLIV